MKTIAMVLSSLATFFSLTASAGPLKFNSDDEPVCYSGNSQLALTELLNLDYDPALSRGRIFGGSRDGKILLYAEQYDENGWILRKFVLPPCK